MLQNEKDPTGSNHRLTVRQDDKKVTIKGIMKTAHSGDKSLKAKVTKAAKAKDWDEAETAAKEWVKHAEALSKATPTKGEDASWKKLTASYEKQVKAVASGVADKDEKGVKTALGAVNSSCGACHKAHKGK